MKFRCERDTLADAVATAQRAVASRTGAMPVLSGLRVTLAGGSLELVGTDLELTIRVQIPADADGEGSAVVPARLFSEIVHKLEGGTVTVELTEPDAHIESGRFATSLRTLSVTEFPRLAETSESGVRVEAAAFADALRQVVPGASRDDARPILTGVLLTTSGGGLRLVSTDSYRLALRDLPGKLAQRRFLQQFQGHSDSSISTASTASRCCVTAALPSITIPRPGAIRSISRDARI